MVDEATWYFAFTEGERNTFWSKWCKRGFSHCAVFASVGHNIVSVEPTTTGISIRNHFDPNDPGRTVHPDELISEWKKLGWRVVRHTFGQGAPRKLLSISNCWPSCVTVCKITSGYSPWCFTPWQYYKALIKDGAEEL